MGRQGGDGGETFEGLSPYCGEEMERQLHLGRSHVQRRFGHDDGGRTYRFNALGYRGDDLDPSATERVYVFGESHAFGYFVELEDSWPSRFVDHWCAHHELDRERVEVLNFADPGASNASIARLVVSQCAARCPDLVLVHFADIRRSEVLLDARPHRIGPWLLDGTTIASIDEAPDGSRATLRELVERGKGYFRYCLGAEERWLAPVADHTCLLETLRQILLVQSFCRAEGIRLVATCDRMEDLRAMAPQNDPTLAPLVAAVDDASLCNFGIWSMPAGTDDEAAGHASPERHELFARAMFTFYRDGPSPPPDLPATSRPREDRAQATANPVRSFYAAMPFNDYDSDETAADTVEPGLVAAQYPDLDRLLRSGDVRRVVECGCGTGWLSNAMALDYDLEVTGLDREPKAITRARAVARRLGLAERVRFEEQDVLAVDDPERFGGSFDLLVSLGVLHHLPVPRRAFEHVSTWAPRLYVGLYHRPGRTPFLEHFRGLVHSAGVDAARSELRRFGVGVDDRHFESWFRDQVLHPRETSHTLREVVGWLDDAGFELVSTSINRFRPIRRLEPLYRAEQKLAARSRKALRRRRFVPGFFTVQARRRNGWRSKKPPARPGA